MITDSGMERLTKLARVARMMRYSEMEKQALPWGLFARGASSVARRALPRLSSFARRYWANILRRGGQYLDRWRHPLSYGISPTRFFPNKGNVGNTMWKNFASSAVDLFGLPVLTSVARRYGERRRLYRQNPNAELPPTPFQELGNNAGKFYSRFRTNVKKVPWYVGGPALWGRGLPGPETPLTDPAYVVGPTVNGMMREQAVQPPPPAR